MKDIANLSGPLYQLRIFYSSDSNYNIEYICEALPSALIADNARRIQRVRYNKSDSNVADKMFAVNNIPTRTQDHDYGIQSIEFIFKAVDKDYCEALVYDVNP